MAGGATGLGAFGLDGGGGGDGGNRGALGRGPMLGVGVERGYRPGICQNLAPPETSG